MSMQAMEDDISVRLTQITIDGSLSTVNEKPHRYPYASLAEDLNDEAQLQSYLTKIQTICSDPAVFLSRPNEQNMGPRCISTFRRVWTSKKFRQEDQNLIIATIVHIMGRDMRQPRTPKVICQLAGAQARYIWKHHDDLLEYKNEPRDEDGWQILPDETEKHSAEAQREGFSGFAKDDVWTRGLHDEDDVNQESESRSDVAANDDGTIGHEGTSESDGDAMDEDIS